MTKRKLMKKYNARNKEAKFNPEWTCMPRNNHHKLINTSQKNKFYFDNLPAEIQDHILQYFSDIMTVARASLVDKKRYSMIRQSSWAYLVGQRSTWEQSTFAQISKELYLIFTEKERLLKLGKSELRYEQGYPLGSSVAIMGFFSAIMLYVNRVNSIGIVLLTFSGLIGSIIALCLAECYVSSSIHLPAAGSKRGKWIQKILDDVQLKTPGITECKFSFWKSNSSIKDRQQTTLHKQWEYLIEETRMLKDEIVECRLKNNGDSM